MYGVIGGHVAYKLPDWGYWIAGFGVVSRIVMGLCWQVMETLALRTTSEDRALSDAPPGLTEFAVELVLHDAHGSYGADRGFVWFEDGLMTFNGAACSFVVSAADLYSRREPNGKNLYHQMPGNAIRFRVPGKTVYATVRPLSSLRGLSFDYQLGRFMASYASGVRPRQWPPLTSYGMQPSVPVPTLDTPEAVGESAARTGNAFGVVRNRP